MEFRLLGRFEVEHEGRPVTLGRRRERCLLGVLLLEANAVVPVDRLVDLLWDGAPPGEPKAAIQAHVSRVRALLEPTGEARLVRFGDGYRVEVDPGTVDALRFRAAVDRARIVADPTERAVGLRRALDLWRGPLLADVGSDRLRERLGGPWRELYLLARESAVDADLARGRHQEVIGELTGLCGEYPLRERFSALLMLALYRSGRQADALDVYTRTGRRLRDELGVEPGAELRDLHQRILRADSDLTAAPAESEDAAAGPLPRQLPVAVRHFTGRNGELKTLMELPDEVGAAGGTVVISAIDGMAGVGKTALAVHAGHLLAEHFPDGQVFIDLHGYTRDVAPRTPSGALAVILRSLGMAPERIPEDLDTRTSLYRERLAGTRTLIVLDNAVSEAQVRPLIPGSGGCLVIVTSRRRLKGLDDAYALPLDVLLLPDAVALFREVAGPGRAAADDPRLEEIANLCGRLPLALRIAASLLRHRPAWTPAHLEDRLRDARSGLARFSDGDRDLSKVFDLSLRALPEDRRRLFALLGLSPGPDIDAYAAAALLDADPAAVERLLQDLVDHNLLTEPSPGRYQFHDLVRAHAVGEAAQEPAGASGVALVRLFDYYMHTAARADASVARYHRPRPAGPAPAHAPDLPDAESALAWLRDERANLLACLDHATLRGADERIVALTAGVAALLRTDGSWSQAVGLHAASRAAAERLGEPGWEAAALSDSGYVRRVTGDIRGAAGDLELAIDLYRELGDRHGEAAALTEIGGARRAAGEHQLAIRDLEQALALHRDLGDAKGQGYTLTELGIERYLTGEHQLAIRDLEEALALQRAVGNRHGQATALIYLAGVRRVSRDFATVVTELEESLRLHRSIGDRNGEAAALSELGGARCDMGDYQGAIRDVEHAFQAFRALGSRGGQASTLTTLGVVRRKLGDPEGAAGCFEQALELYRSSGSRGNVAWVLNQYAPVFVDTGELARAESLHHEALGMAREMDLAEEEALALQGIGECRVRGGDVGDGVVYLNQALEIFRRLGMPEAAQVETRLAELS